MNETVLFYKLTIYLAPAVLIGIWHTAARIARNWRMTFKINEQDALNNIDLEDYYGA